MANFTISPDNIITMHKGTNVSFPIFINLGNKVTRKQYILRSADNLYVGITEPNQPFEYALIRKIIKGESCEWDENNCPVLKLVPSDTLHVLPGDYYIEIKIELANGNVATILPKTRFVIYE